MNDIDFCRFERSERKSLREKSGSWWNIRA